MRAPILDAVASASQWRDEAERRCLLCDVCRYLDPAERICRQRISQSYATRLVRLAWLAPDIVEAILGGCQPANLTASRLMQDTRILTDWQEQRRALGFV
ncbi:hypothetical protein [Neoroseomonas oryzicola]|uniref:Uncharacterized protein n=1 Tax=Neoroseomonas oryzicola TaxID=535904 RepID=A0A9X9WQ08_9PROT|nr:hypothetical protein [Neoroseomonas oryzicola]MBR0662418.1 hypothetical protein [Neoroseomonas oryzicola]NKE20323.1 hypothetical protein [Neoroseomonas oryzicola]